ncbi:MAG TPA: heme o synthase [Anaerolineales bacterium]|nr:heme o synthase [Anaerolineales bacterium]
MKNQTTAWVSGHWPRWFGLGAAAATYLVLVLGAVQGRTGAAAACPDWPLCEGSVLATFSTDVLIASGHRVAGLLAFLLALATAVAIWARPGGARWLRFLSLAALGLFLVEGGAGALVVLDGAQPLPVAFHLAMALLTLAVQVALAAILFGASRSEAAFDWPVFTGPLTRKSLGASTLAFLLLVSGATMAAGQAKDCAGSIGCNVWTLSWQLFEPQGLIHRITAAAVGLMVLWLTAGVWRERRRRPAAAVAASATAGLMLAQISIGALGTVQSLTSVAADLHVGTAGAVWALLVLTTVFLATERPRPVEDTRLDSLLPASSLKDYLALSKPLIVVLLLVTTLAGMVVAAGGWPSLSTILWTMLGGALSAGGASALNQYLDRELDSRMQRTEKRPLPGRRLTEAEVLAFGVLLCLTGFFVLAVMVNLLSALLSLAGMVYYVVLYTIILKQATTQNIVVGGGAGAIPPLVGWAAATNSLNVGAFFLFALVFFWTPPHFWALALLRRKDYERAGVPMLPVVYGDAHTRWQIMLYTVQVVALTLLMPAVHVGGRLYLVAAIVLGGGLLLTAWRLWREGGNRLAWRMYRYSSMYLAFIFAALVLDTLLSS